MKKRMLPGIISLLVFAAALFGNVLPVAADASTGAVNTYFSVNNATYISVDMKPSGTEDGYHYYSLSPFFQGQSYGTYAGIQTNGNLGSGSPIGNVFIFSVWNATVAYPENGATATPFGGEGVGYSLRKAYDWQVGQTYTVKIQREAYDSANGGWRWSAQITNRSSGATLKLGEIVSPAAATALATGAVFHERYQGTAPSCGTTSNLEQTGVTFSNLASDRSIGFYGSPAPNGIFASSACAPFISYSLSNGVVVTKFGTGQTTPSSTAPTTPRTAPTAKPAEPTPAAPEATPAPEEVKTTTVTPTPAKASVPKKKSLPWLAMVISGVTVIGVSAGVLVYFKFFKFPRIKPQALPAAKPFDPTSLGAHALQHLKHPPDTHD